MLQTLRLEIREVVLSDRAFIFRLLNEPSWLENIGDRGVRSEADAETYITNHIRGQYRAVGYGMYALLLRSTQLPIGLCGLVRREFLSAPDLGFALLPEYVGHGYAAEAARSLLAHAKLAWSVERLYAIVRPGNQRSVRLLQQLGFRRQGICSTPQGGDSELYEVP
jgi:ribosomal-protein-alanine N-acetyltransferase